MYYCIRLSVIGHIVFLLKQDTAVQTFLDFDLGRFLIAKFNYCSSITVML